MRFGPICSSGFRCDARSHASEHPILQLTTIGTPDSYLGTTAALIVKRSRKFLLFHCSLRILYKPTCAWTSLLRVNRPSASNSPPRRYDSKLVHTLKAEGKMVRERALAVECISSNCAIEVLCLEPVATCPKAPRCTDKLASDHGTPCRL